MKCKRIADLKNVMYFMFTNLLQKVDEAGAIYGHAYLHSAVAREGRWGVARALYPLPLYPAYVSGTGYVLDVHGARRVLRAARHVPLVPIEDAFFTGILPQVIIF